MSNPKRETRDLRNMKVNFDEAAKFLKLSKSNFYRLIESGVLPKSEDSEYVLGEVVDAYYQRRSNPEDLKAEQTRLTAVQADLKELELAELRGELHRGEAVLKVWTENVSNTRSRLLAIPAKISPKVLGKDLQTIQLIIKEEIYEALKELAEYDSGRITRTAIALKS